MICKVNLSRLLFLITFSLTNCREQLTAAQVLNVSGYIDVKILAGHTGSVRLAEFSPDGTTIVTASFDATAKIWDANTGECLHTLTGHTGNVNSAVFSPDGTKIVTVSNDRTAKICDAKTGECLHTLVGHEGCVNKVVFSPDGTKIVTASDDGTAKI